MYLNDPRHWSQVSNQVLWCVQSFCIKGTGVASVRDAGKYVVESHCAVKSIVETWSTSRAKFFASFLSAKACSIMASSGSPCGAHLRNWRVCGWPSGGLTESNWFVYVSFIQACTHCFSYSSSFLQKLIVSFLACFLHRFLPSYWFVCFNFNSLNPPACQRVLVFAETMLKVWVSSCADCCFAYVALAECIVRSR